MCEHMRLPSVQMNHRESQGDVSGVSKSASNTPIASLQSTKYRNDTEQGAARSNLAVLSRPKRPEEPLPPSPTYILCPATVSHQCPPSAASYPIRAGHRTLSGWAASPFLALHLGVAVSRRRFLQASPVIVAFVRRALPSAVPPLATSDNAREVSRLAPGEV